MGLDPRTGKVWKKVKSWFGLHLIADVEYEVPVAFKVTPASASEGKVLEEMIATQLAPEVLSRVFLRGPGS